MERAMQLFIVCHLLTIVCLVGSQRAELADDTLPLLLNEDFENGFSRWQTTDPKGAEPVWKNVELEPKGNHALRATGKSKYKPPYLSPLTVALLKDVEVSDYELTAHVQQTRFNAGPHRDLCFFWGYQDPSHFYYVHLGSRVDEHACQIFVVNNSPRAMITVKQAKGTPWTKGWHDVKVVRRVEDGTMEVYFDDMKTPFMTAKDKTFTGGQIGIGTFDDHGNFDNVVLRGKRVTNQINEGSD
jgi:hypothetical protein